MKIIQLFQNITLRKITNFAPYIYARLKTIQEEVKNVLKNTHTIISSNFEDTCCENCIEA